jgi:uncharacterized protein (DUF433 family)
LRWYIEVQKLLEAMEMATATSWIQKRPEVCGGDACIRNTRITVWGLVESRKLGMSDAEILKSIQGLTPADLEAAWEYYGQHTAEIDQALWENYAAMIDAGAPIPTWLLVRGRQLGLADDRIRAAFEPALSQSRLDSAWTEYERDPGPIDEIIRHQAEIWSFMALLYADEDFDYRVVEELRRTGHDVLTVQEAGQQGGDDQQVLTFAIGASRAVLTFNRRHFMRLHRRVPSHRGIIICTKDADSVGLAARIHQTLSTTAILDNQLVRITRPPIP